MSVVAGNSRAPGLFTQGIAKAVESASESEVRRALLQMLGCDERAFCRAAGGLLLGGDSSGSGQLVRFLLRHKRLIESLVSAEQYDAARALAVVRSAAKIGPLLEEELEQALSSTLHKAPSAPNVVRVLRTLELMTAAAPARFLALQHELMAYPDPKVRSKAALLAVRSGRTTASLGRLLSDTDARVQANCVEALWSLDAASSGPMLHAAAKSPHHRVRGNALAGLYRISDVACIAGMFEMAQHPDARFRTTAFWTMGAAGDPRFVLFLNDQLRRRTGSERLAILRALARIRKQEKIFAEAGSIEILVSSATVQPDGSRRLALALRATASSDLSIIPPTRFQVWEGGSLMHDYKALAARNPALLIAAMVAPSDRSGDAFARSTGAALARCLPLKRAEDLWRIDRYALQAPASPPSGEASNSPQKGQHGFLSSVKQIEGLLSDSATSAPSAPGALAALEKAAEAIRRLSGARHLFVFFHPDSMNEWLNEQRRVEQLAALIGDERIALHGLAPKSANDAGLFRELCLSAKGGTYDVCAIDAIPETTEHVYSQLINRYEITYRASDGDLAPGTGTIVIASEHGCGKVSYTLTPLPPAAS